MMLFFPLRRVKAPLLLDGEERCGAARRGGKLGEVVVVVVVVVVGWRRWMEMEGLHLRLRLE